MATQASLECGNCPTCMQHHVLGQFVVDDEEKRQFRCYACIDEHGTDVIAHPKPVKQECDTPEAPANWWAHPDVPAHFADVPLDKLVTKRLFVQTGPDHFTEEMVSVTDPEHNYFSGHGIERVWPAASAVAEFLTQRIRPSGRFSVVELGAGTGLCGMAIAKSLARTNPEADVEVVLTDVPWLKPLTMYNVQHNFDFSEAGWPLVMPLRWGNQKDLAQLADALGGRRPDLVIGSDVVYLRESFDDLLNTIAALEAAEVVLAVVRRDNVLGEFRNAVHKHGFQEELYDVTGSDSLGWIQMMRLVKLESSSEEEVEPRETVPSIWMAKQGVRRLDLNMGGDVRYQ